MTPDQIDLVEQSFAVLADDADRLARSFYSRLFTIAPDVRSLFPDDLTEQRSKLVTELAAIAGAVRNVAALAPRLERLGERHVGYRVRDEHYEPVGMALLFAIGERLGGQATPEVLEAWRAAYTTVATVMMQGAREAEAAAA